MFMTTVIQRYHLSEGGREREKEREREGGGEEGGGGVVVETGRLFATWLATSA